MYRIGYRTLKTAIATGIAIAISEGMGLENYISAGIITILCIQVTVKRSLQAAISRFFCCMINMTFGTIIFEGIGYYPWAITILLLLYIPVTVRFKIQEGIVTSCVIMLHLYKSKHIDGALLVNEFWLVVIGIGAALALNIFMPNLEKKLIGYQQEIEEQFKEMFAAIATNLMTGEGTFPLKSIAHARKTITLAKGLALRQLENQLLQDRDYYYQYFTMREKQLEIIEHIVHISTYVEQQREQGKWVGHLLDNIGKIVSPKGTATITLYEVNEMRTLFRGMDLPKTREEFEERAHLLQIIDELERYLTLKNKFYNQSKHQFLQMEKGTAF